VLATAIYFGFACYLTWPLIAHLGHSIYGAPGDPYGTMGFYSSLIARHQNPFLPGTMSQFAAPEGIPIPWPRDLAAAPGTLSLYLLTVVFGAIPAFGLYTLAGYTLTGVLTFLFARRLTDNTWASLIAGWAFAFYPFAALNGQGHLDFVQGWVLVLAVWRTIELMWYPSRRNGVLAGLAVVLAMWWSPYFILFAGVAYVAATAPALLFALRDRRLGVVLVPQLIAAAIVLVFMAGLGALSTTGAAEGIGARADTISEINFYSARALEYVVPDVQSPLFGGATHHYIETLERGGSAIENTIYVGATILLLALVALAALVRRRLATKIGRAVVVLSLIAIAAALTSMPPEAHVLGVLLPFPSHFISEASATWRVYSRFAIVVMLALSALAAIGLAALTRDRTSRTRIAILSLATIAIPLDLWAPQGGHVDTIPTPGIYKTLARAPAGLVAEYPLAPSSHNVYADQFYEHLYDKPILGGYLPGTFSERRANSLAVLSDPSTAPRLATLGVRYVLVDATPTSWGWPEYTRARPGLRLIAHEPYADLYVVSAHPLGPALATAGDAFGELQLSDIGKITWLEHPYGFIDLAGPCNDCNGVLSMTVASYAQPREVSILDSRGHVLGRSRVFKPTQVRVPLRFDKQALIKVAIAPEPQLAPQAPGGPTLGVQITNLEFAYPGSSGVGPVPRIG
jgi:hypothetical protein